MVFRCWARSQLIFAEPVRAQNGSSFDGRRGERAQIHALAQRRFRRKNRPSNTDNGPEVKPKVQWQRKAKSDKRQKLVNIYGFVGYGAFLSRSYKRQTDIFTQEEEYLG